MVIDVDNGNPNNLDQHSENDSSQIEPTTCFSKQNFVGTQYTYSLTLTKLSQSDE